MTSSRPRLNVMCLLGLLTLKFKFLLGTTNPIWLNGKLPQEADQVEELTAYVKKKENCYYNGWKTMVKKCSKNEEEYFVYQLKPVRRCPYVYCAG